MKLSKGLNRLAGRFGYSFRKTCDIPTVCAGKRPDGQSPSDDHAPIQAHMFWAYGEFSMLERLAAASFVANGFRLKLWSYGQIAKVPPGVELCDAREILAEDRVFTYHGGSYAGFADLFRYMLLSREGGLWADTDVICLVPAAAVKALGPNGFFVTERTKDGSVQINANLIHHPAPAPGDLIDFARVVAERFAIDRMTYGDIGPKLLTTLVTGYPRLAPAVMSPEFANPLDWWDCPQCLLSSATELPDGAWFLHGFNEMWRRSGTDKNDPYPADSLLGKVLARYHERL